MFLKTIDGFLRDRTQSLCDAFTRITGRTKFSLQVWLLVTFLVTFFLYAWSENLLRWPRLMIYALVLGMSFLASKECLAEEQFFIKKEVFTSRSGIPYIRLFFVFFVTVNILTGLSEFDAVTAILYSLWQVAFALWFYVVACSPVLPHKGIESTTAV